MTDSEIFQLIRSGWTQLMAILTLVVWAVRLDMRNRSHSARLDRHETRMRMIEASHNDHAVQFARIDETLAGIKLTLDRIYDEVSESRKSR